MDKLAGDFFRAEDRLARFFCGFPRENRIDSFPFAASDTYSFGCKFELSTKVFIKRNGLDDSIYINGNDLPEVLPRLLSCAEKLKRKLDRVVIGDSDQPPSMHVLNEISQISSKVFCVNIPFGETHYAVQSLPLGLESQRYRSAGQLRDFKKIPRIDSRARNIGLLVAWNDATYPTERSRAREILRNATTTLEIVDRVPARLIHKLMRRSLFVICPRGNGLDTHRFWESLYLGAIPVVLSKHRTVAFEGWPSLVIEDWSELIEFDGDGLRKLYEERLTNLANFRNNIKEFIVRDMKR